jgi:hypothetical protein
MEGYPKAAANFCKEANMETPDDECFTQTLWEVRQQMQRGDMQAAIESLNEIDPKVRSAIASILYMIKIRVLHAPRIGLRAWDEKQPPFMILHNHGVYVSPLDITLR